jgi:hypothetical protein
LTHTAPGKPTFKKGAPQILTDPELIRFYQTTGGFTVTMLKEDPPKAKAPVVEKKSTPPPAKASDDSVDDVNEDAMKDAVKSTMKKKGKKKSGK